MELLAPAGSKEALVAAARAGADAVYIGAPGFNARLSAKNITFYDMAVLIDYAHEKGLKVYAAMNTLIKHAEIHSAVKLISGINRLGADAFIIQDLGLAEIISKHFENIEMHASTQLAVHNRMGVDILAEAGFRRVILARELSYPELKLIAKGAPAELEIFCHGALCFSLSGQCLFSSFIGGHSGNRGLCTQPCRRLWLQGKRKGYLLSPRDLQLAEELKELKKIKITSLKIEGRMRSAEYVYRTVKAYRLLTDASDSDFPEALAEARAMLSSDYAREKTACLFSGRDDKIFEPERTQCLGNRLGEVAESSADSVVITLSDGVDGIMKGDRLRLSSPSGDITRAFKVKDFSADGKRRTFPLENADDFKKGDPVFITASPASDQQDMEKEVDEMYKNYNLKNKGKAVRAYQVRQDYTSLISNKWNSGKKAEAAEDRLWLRFSDIKWPDSFTGTARHIFALNRDNIHKSFAVTERLGADTVMELPPFIAQRETDLFRGHIEKMLNAGVKNWTLNNIAHLGFFRDKGCSLSAGQFLYAWNAYAAAFLDDRGVTSFNVSWEDDFLNIRDLTGPVDASRLMIYLYGHPPAARSRILTNSYIGGDVIQENDKGDKKAKDENAFYPVAEAKLTLLIAEKPVCLFSSRRKLRALGISNFGIDLSYMPPGRKELKDILDSYDSGESIPSSVRFNFKRGVK